MNNNKSVYAGGPITGSSFKEVNDWRQYAQFSLERYGIKVISPLRNKGYLKGETELKHSYCKTLSLPRSIVTRDIFDVRNCDVIFMNFIDSKIVSIGSVMEIAAAYMLNKPIVMVTGDNTIHEHPFVNEMVSFKVKTLDEGLEIVKNILEAY